MTPQNKAPNLKRPLTDSQPSTPDSGYELHIPEWGPALTIDQCVFTRGGSTIILPRVANVGAKNFSQSDQTENQALWNLFPVETLDPTNRNIDQLEKLEKTAAKETGRFTSNPSMTNTIPKLKAASPSHERHRIYANMLTLDVIMETLWTHGLLKSDRSLDGDHISEGERWSRAIFQNKMIMGASPVSRPRDYPLPAQHPAIRKALNVIEPLKGLVLRLERKLQMAHDVYYSCGDYITAIHEYISILFDLYPWVSSPLIFKNNDAFQFGVAQLESAAWLKLSLTCLKLARITMNGKWYSHALDTANAVINMRFTTYQALSKAHFIAYEAKANLYDFDPLPLSHYSNKHRCRAVSAIDSYIVAQALKLVDASEDEWVHKDCVKTHTCTKHQHRVMELMASGEIPSVSITIPHGLDVSLIIKADFSVNDD